MRRIDAVATVRRIQLDTTSEGHSGRSLRRLSISRTHMGMKRGVFVVFASCMDDCEINVDRDAFCIVGFIYNVYADPRVAAPMTVAHEPRR
jgi:hypothetical protein